MPQIDVKAEGEDKIRITFGVATSIVLTNAEAEGLREKLRKAIAAGATEDHLRRMGAL